MHKKFFGPPAWAGLLGLVALGLADSAAPAAGPPAPPFQVAHPGVLRLPGSTVAPQVLTGLKPQVQPSPFQVAHPGVLRRP
jgi:hypothetical protein